MRKQVSRWRKVERLKFSSTSGLRVSSREGPSLELKESFNWGSKDEYGKTAAAFANVKGGIFVFGVKDSPRELVGLQSSNFEDLDEAKVAEYFNSTFSPEIEFEKFVEVIRGKRVGFLRIEPSNRKPVVAIKNDKEIREGEIYYRYNARSDKVKYPEMRSLLEDIQAGERKYWKSIFERIAKIGSDNVAVMDVAEGVIEGKGGTVIIDESLLPKFKFIKEGSFKEGGLPTLKLVGDVMPISIIASKKVGRGKNFQITTDPSAPLMRIEEESLIKQFPLDYLTLTSSLRQRYKDFKTDNRYHKIRKELASKGFAKTRKLNPNKPDGTKQDFYSLAILSEFDNFYNKK